MRLTPGTFHILNVVAYAVVQLYIATVQTAHALVPAVRSLHETARWRRRGPMPFRRTKITTNYAHQPHQTRPSCQQHGDQQGGNADGILSRPVLVQITPDGCSSSSSTSARLVGSVARAVAGGVCLVQLRDYKADAESKVELARRIRQVIDGSPALLMVNVNDGDYSWVRDCGADGVHLPEREIGLLADLRDSNARPVWPAVVGCSVHSATAALEAARLGADYVQVGTMFATQSHPGKEPEGLRLLSEVRRRLDGEGLGRVLVIGVGGIDGENCGSVMAADADGVAAIRCLCSGDGADQEARRMLDAMRKTMVATGR